jgi:hypothetical protein
MLVAGGIVEDVPFPLVAVVQGQSVGVGGEAAGRGKIDAIAGGLRDPEFVEPDAGAAEEEGLGGIQADRFRNIFLADPLQPERYGVALAQRGGISLGWDFLG